MTVNQISLFIVAGSWVLLFALYVWQRRMLSRADAELRQERQVNAQYRRANRQLRRERDENTRRQSLELVMEGYAGTSRRRRLDISRDELGALRVLLRMLGGRPRSR